MTESVFSSSAAWTIYHATLEFTGRLIGGSPSDPDLIEGWLAKNLGITDEEQLATWTRKHLAEIHGPDAAVTEEDVDAAISKAASEKKAQVFKRDAEGRPYIEGRQIKAMLKEATNIAYPRIETKWGQRAGKAKEYVGKMVGGKDPVDYLAERVFIPEIPYVLADEISGVDLAVGHIKDERTGQKRSTLSYFEYVDRPTLVVEVRALDDCISEEQWARIWTVGEHNGLGARRSQGAGQFVVTKWERMA